MFEKQRRSQNSNQHFVKERLEPKVKMILWEKYLDWAASQQKYYNSGGSQMGVWK